MAHQVGRYYYLTLASFLTGGSITHFPLVRMVTLVPMNTPRYVCSCNNAVKHHTGLVFESNLYCMAAMIHGRQMRDLVSWTGGDAFLRMRHSKQEE